MNESEFVKLWASEKPLYEAWGDYVVKAVIKGMEAKGRKASEFFKVSPGHRLKDDTSLLDKAFYRASKKYSDPYNQIEDKVGARFVVLLLENITEICEVIEGDNTWIFDRCKHFDEDRKKDPLLFTYQSVHYILRPKQDVLHNGVSIPSSTPCEVQIRTLLQHAHAELTHDAIYKAKRTIQPNVHRTVAKSMALIETTDDFFVDVTTQLNSGPLEQYGIQDRLDGVYYSLTGLKPHRQKSSILIWDAFERFIDECLVDQVAEFLAKQDGLGDIIKERYAESVMYQQSVVLFVYWLLKKKRRRLLRDWPLSKGALEPLANDIGVSTWVE